MERGSIFSSQQDPLFFPSSSEGTATFMQPYPALHASVLCLFDLTAIQEDSCPSHLSCQSGVWRQSPDRSREGPRDRLAMCWLASQPFSCCVGRQAASF